MFLQLKYMNHLILSAFILLLTIPVLPQKITLFGTVSDRISGESLIGANVIISEGSTGVASNNYGFYSLSLKPGTYTFVCSYLGYQADTFKLNISENLKRNISLEPIPLQINLS